MKKAADYRKHALECRALARGTHKEDERRQLLKMADAWTLLADEREFVPDDVSRIDPPGGKGSRRQGSRRDDCGGGRRPSLTVQRDDGFLSRAISCVISLASVRHCRAKSA